MSERFTNELVLSANADEFVRARARACVYCGNTTSLGRDHVIPVSWARGYRDYRPGDTVICCDECNSVLGDILLFSIESRADYLYNKYLVRHRKAINMPEWTEEEILDKDYGLQKKIRGGLAEKRFILARLRHLLDVIGDSSEIKVRQETMDMRDAYKIFEVLNNSRGFRTLPEAIRGLGLDEKLANRYLTTKAFHSIRITWLNEKGIRLDVDLRDYFRQSIAARYKKDN